MDSALQIAQLLSLLGRVEGRKKFQKLVHILQELGYSFNERFEYSYYGMYSQQLRGELDSLAADKLISEREVTSHYGNPSFAFEKSERLDELLNEVGVTGEPEWSGAAKMLNAHAPQVLEGVNTILFLRKCGLEGEQLKKRLLALKPHLADGYEHCVHESQAILAFKLVSPGRGK